MSWISVGIAAVGAVTSIAGGLAGSAAAKKAGKAQRGLMLVESREKVKAMHKQTLELSGLQQTGYAAAGVSVEVGTPKALQDELTQSSVEADYYEAQKLHYQMKGASAAANAASSGYLTQGISSAANFAMAGYSAYKTP